MINVKERFQAVKLGKVLDLGTGSGEFISMLIEISKEYEEIIGIDTNENSLKKAKTQFPDDRIKFLVMPAQDTDFEDNSFDVVSISNTLHHLQDMHEVIVEMLRVLKPGGLLIINEMYRDSDKLSSKQMSHVKIHHLHAKMDTLLGICHKETFTKEQILQVAKTIGLKNLKSFDYNTNEEQMQEEDLDLEKTLIEGAFQGLATRLEQIQGFQDFSEIKKLFDMHKKEISDIGIFGATQTLIIGTK